ncbi:MAG: hypothetical protein KGL31_10110 [candidate division NC10 bacterium]|nr:hypothetical protein [candidate division NC10 bacterium]MDE2322251.1 hypothetical protein [candidate division NC10 bacterium]
MAQSRWWVRGVVLGSALLLAPVGAWADKLQDLEQRYEDQQTSLQQLHQEVQRLRQERTTQQAETDRRVMEVEKKAAETAASSLLTGYEPGKGFYLKSADGQFRLNLGGYLQTWMQVQGSRKEEDFPSGDAAAARRHQPSTFRERRTRIILSGQVFKDFNFYIEPEFSFGKVAENPGHNTDVSTTGGTRLENGWVAYTYAPWAQVKVGQFRNFFSLEKSTAPYDLDFAEWAVVPRALAPGLQLGALVSGNLNLPIMNMPFYYGVGIFNGCGRIDQCQNGVASQGDKEFAGRFAFSPPMPLGNLTIALNADYRSFRIVNGNGETDEEGVTTVAQLANGQRFHRFNPLQATDWRLAGDGLIGTSNGFLINGNRVTGGGDIVWDFYPFMIKGEYLYSTQERDGLVGATGKPLDNLIMQGGYGTIGYWVFGNKRNGLQAIGRYEHMRIDDRTGVFDAPTADPNERPMEMRSGTLGLNWYVNPAVRLRANYILTDVRPGQNTIGVSNSTHGELVHQGIAEVQLLF